MELKDLFVSYKQVNPVKFEIKNQNLPTPIYNLQINLLIPYLILLIIQLILL